MLKDIEFDYNTGEIIFNEVLEGKTVKQTLLNTLKIQVGELYMTGYRDFGSDFKRVERENQIPEDELEEIVRDALEIHVQSGLIDEVSSVQVDYERSDAFLIVSVRRGDTIFNVAI